VAEIQYFVRRTVAGVSQTGWVGDSQLAFDDGCEMWCQRTLAGRASSEWLDVDQLDATCKYWASFDLASGRSTGWTATPPAAMGPGRYYVSANGSDSADGLTPATAWKTMAKVSGFTFASGDRILLRRGNRWKEVLTLPRSSLTIGAYGDAPIYDSEGYCTNAPVYDGGEPLTGFSAYAGGAEVRTIVDAMTGVAGTDLTVHAPNTGTGWAKHVMFPTFNCQISSANRMRRAASATNQTAHYANPVVATPDYYVQADVFVASLGVDFCTLMARWFSYKDTGYWVRLGGATGSFAFGKYSTGAITTFQSGTNLAPVGGETYTLRIEVQGSQVTAMVKLQGAGTWAQTLTIADTEITEGNNCGIKMGSASSVVGGDAAGLHVDSFECGPLGVVGSPTNTYQSTLGTPALLVSLDGALGIRGPNTDQLANGQWYWQNGVLYVRRDAGVPTATSTVVATRVSGIIVGARTDTTIQDVAIELTSSRAIDVTAGGHRTTVKRCYAQRASTVGPSLVNGVFGASSADDFAVSQSVIRECDNDGIYVQQGLRPVITDNLVRTIQGVASDCIQSDGQGLTVNAIIARNKCSTLGSNSPKGCIIVFGDAYTIEDNYCQGAGGAGRSSGNYGISIGSGAHYIIRRNVVYNMSNDGIRITSNGDTTEIRDDFQVHHNVVLDCGIGIYLVVRGTNQLWYANTIVNVARAPQFNAAADHQVRVEQTMGGEFKDNVIWDATGSGRALRVIQVTTTPTSDYNLIGPQATNYINWGGTLYSTIAAFVAGTGKDANSIAADPRFVNLGGHAADGSDYATLVGSLARGRGVVIAGVVADALIGAK
jgi:hypothetical protein